jgi:hypothetical protein
MPERKDVSAGPIRRAGFAAEFDLHEEFLAILLGNRKTNEGSING